MGRNVVVEPRTGGAAAHEVTFGEIEIEPTLLRQDGDITVLPEPTKAGIANGRAVLEDVAVSPAGPNPAWAYKVTIRNHRTGRAFSEIVGVPAGTSSVFYSRLPRFITTLPPQTTKAELQNWAATTQTNAERAEAAAAAAQAPTDQMFTTLLGAPASKSSLALATTLDLAANPALGILFAAYARALTEPVGVVPLGSSTTAGTDQKPADRWVNRLIGWMQESYAAGPGAETEVGTLSTPRNTLPGIHGYNGGVSGARTDTYVTAGMVTQIGILAPSIITHMIGSNDANHGYTAAQYKGFLEGRLDALDAAVSTPHVHILIHAHERSDNNVSVLWREYREVLRQIARERPGNVAFIDLSRDYEAIGFPTSDPLGFLMADKVHLQPTGHEFTAKLLGEALAARRNAPWRIVVRDNFERSNGPLGSADTGQPWRVVAGSFEITDGKALLKAGGTVLIESGSTDVDISMDLYHSGVADALTGIVFSADDNDNRLGFYFNAGAGQQISFNLTRAGANTTLWTQAKSINPGTYRVRVVKVGNKVSAYMDGLLVAAYTLSTVSYDATKTYTKVGFRCGGNVYTMSYDNVRVLAR